MSDEQHVARPHQQDDGSASLASALATAMANAFVNHLAEEKAEKLLRMLDTYAFGLTHDQRQAIGACTDLDRIGFLYDHALEIPGAHDAFRGTLTAWVAQESSPPGRS